MRFNRLFLLCSLGVVIPSMILIGLGFFSLRTEKRLREKQVAERLGSSVEVWIMQIDAALQSAMAQHKGWEFSGVLDSEGRWIEPFHQTVEFSWPALSSSSAARLAAIERTESVENSQIKAANDYELLAWNLANPQWKAALLLRAAVCRRKTQAWPQAQESLEHVGRRYADLRNDHGTPFGLLVAIEFAELYAASGHMEHAIDKTLETLTNLEHRGWLLSWKSEKLFTQRLHERLRAWAPSMTEAQKSRWHARIQVFNARAARVHMLEDWQADDWPSIQALLRAEARLDRPTLVWPEHAADLALWINPDMDPDTGQRRRTQIAWCQPTTMEELWRHSNRGSATEAGFTAQIHPVSKSAVDGLKGQLTLLVPPMELRIRATGSSADAYAATRKKMYWTMIVLASVAFVMTLKIMWHSLKRELDVAWLKTRFVTTAFSEIQTPPSIIEFIGQRIRLKGYENSQQAENYYTMLKEEMLRLKNLIEDVLDFSRQMDNRVPYPLIRFDWVPALRQTIERFQQSERGRAAVIDFTLSLPACFIEGHPEALARAVLNVLENAVTYSSPDRGTLRVLLRQQQDHVLLDITDHGDGISLSEQPLVFNRFWRGAAAHKRSLSGAGLGLSIARYIIQAHHGTLTLQSALGKGSTFTIRLPLFPVQ